MRRVCRLGGYKHADLTHANTEKLRRGRVCPIA